MSDVITLITTLIQSGLLLPAIIVVAVSLVAFPTLRALAARLGAARVVRDYNEMIDQSMRSSIETMRRVSDIKRQFADAVGERAEFEAQVRQLVMLNQELSGDIRSMQGLMEELTALMRQASMTLYDALDAATEAAILLDRASVMIEKASPCDDVASSQGDADA